MEQRKKNLSVTIFFSETVAHTKAAPGSLERALRALHAHENRTGVTGKRSSRPTRPYFSYQDLSNRSRVLTHPGKPDRGHWKGLYAPYTPIFFLSKSDQQEPSYNTPGKAGPESLERALLNLVKPNGVTGKGYSRTTRPYFLFQDLTDRSQVLMHLGKPHRGADIASGKSGPESLERALRALHAHIFSIKISPTGADIASRKTGPNLTNRSRVITNLVKPDGVTGKGYSRTTRAYFLFQDLTDRSQVLMHLGKPHRGHWRGLFAPYTPIFFYQDMTNRSRVITENRTKFIGKGSSRPTCPYFLFQDLTNRSRVLMVQREQRKKNFSVTIFFSESVASGKAGPESLETALRALHAHIFSIKI
ncbi:hypothetical protein V1477_017771 [Vespula maculifrons]|uniref:Uncharacterized protein n=1 Tax=Vespula maculifrons TaxID=7453 RepID=A0ABD2B0F7_VESMC